MAKDRIEPCESYIFKGECKKGRDADHNGYCQKCSRYKPRVRRKHINKKKQKLEEKKLVEDSINSSRQACTEAETTMFKCGRCQKNQCTYYQLQTRSCDEPMTTFVRCTNCGHNWKF